MRILIVEDDISLSEMLRQGLSEDGDQVTLVHDGEQGLSIALAQRFDVIVLDIMVPKLSGYRILEHLRKADNWTPVLMLTAKDGEYDQADAFDLGADDYLTKPFSFVVLKARLRALSRRRTVGRPRTLTCGPLSLDPVAHLVKMRDETVDLTPREFGLLQFLMQHKDEAVAKTDILHGVWDSAYIGDPNIVEVYIGYLRRKVEQPFGIKMIDTVRGVGYRLTTPA